VGNVQLEPIIARAHPFMQPTGEQDAAIGQSNTLSSKIHPHLGLRGVESHFYPLPPSQCRVFHRHGRPSTVLKHITIMSEVLLRQLEAQRLAYEDTLRLIQSLPGQEGSLPSAPRAFSEAESTQKSISSKEPARKTSAFAPNLDTSSLSDDSDEEDESYFVQDVLPSKSHDHEHLRDHLKTYSWDQWGRQILASVITDRGRLKDPSLFPDQPGPAEDRSHYSHYQVFDVGSDGAPLLVEPAESKNAKSMATRIWHSIKDINNDSTRQRQAVGRITIAREPSPILFAALHLTMKDAFNMDELFRYLVESDASSAKMHRAFHEDVRRRRSFVFNFEYYTIIGEECKPMQWQYADSDRKASAGHIPLTRCSAVVALSLSGEPIKKVRNPARRAKTKYGFVYDPFASWHVLNIQCYPDWKASTDTHDSSKHYVNGPEAFLHTLLQEYRDAQKRFEEIYHRITKLITPGHTFLFNGDLRDERLFEDPDFTYTRRYFWAHSTLGAMNDCIKSLIDAFEDTFTEDVWDGKDKTLWPLLEEESMRNEFWKRRLKKLRTAFEREIRSLRILIKENNERREEIQNLREQLFSGTSVLESRKSVDLATITIQQGHNIKLLTLVNIFFLPLTFVTSVFGMTNMPTEHHYWAFGITIAAICIPFFCLIGTLSTDWGFAFWRKKTATMYAFFARRKRNKNKEGSDGAHDKDTDGVEMSRSTSAAEGMALRLGRPPGTLVFGRPRNLSIDKDSRKGSKTSIDQKAEDGGIV
jgi:hypothetical protein